MKKVILNEYGINMKYEFNTYKNVGRDYGNRKTLNRGWILNLKRFIRKSIINRNEQRYKFCNTYSEWLEHLKISMPKELSNKNDFLHFLLNEKKREEILLETIKVILIPIYIAILGMYNVFGIQDIESAFCFIIFIMIISCCAVYDATQKVEFYRDLIGIIPKIYGI